jgi:hypothetical protein
LILFSAISGSAIHEAFLVLIDMSIILSFIPLFYMFAALPLAADSRGKRTALRNADTRRALGR